MVCRSWVYCTWRSNCSQHAMEPDIGWDSDFCLPHLTGPRQNIAMTFGVEKLQWLGYPTVKNFCKIYLFVSTESTNVTDRRRQTPHDGIMPRLGLGLKSKNCRLCITKLYFSCLVNSALAGLQKLNEVKDALGKVEKLINNFRGGKQSRLCTVNKLSCLIRLNYWTYKLLSHSYVRSYKATHRPISYFTTPSHSQYTGSSSVVTLSRRVSSLKITDRLLRPRPVGRAGALSGHRRPSSVCLMSRK